MGVAVYGRRLAGLLGRAAGAARGAAKSLLVPGAGAARSFCKASADATWHMMFEAVLRSTAFGLLHSGS